MSGEPPENERGDRATRGNERRDRILDALFEIDAKVRSTLDADEIMQRSLEGAVRALQADGGVIELYEDGQWVIRYQVGFSPTDIGFTISPARAPVGERTKRDRTTVFVADVATGIEGSIEFPRDRQTKSVIATPVMVRDQVTGVVILYYFEHHYSFDEVASEFTDGLGFIVSLAVENARLLEAEGHAARLADSLSSINEILLSALTVDDVTARLVGEVSQTAGADKCLVIAVEGDVYTVTHVRNVRTDLVGVEKPSAFYPGFALAASMRQPLLIEDTWNDPRTNKDFVIPNELRAFQLIPVFEGERVAAVLALAYDKPRTFDADDVTFCERLSRAMSLALKNARLYESEVEARSEARRELESTKLLLEVAQQVAAAAAIEDRLQSVATLVRDAMQHERVLIDLWSNETLELRVAAVAGDPSLARQTYRFDELSRQAQDALRTGHRQTIDYRDVDEALAKTAAEAGFQLALVMPIVFAGRTLGLIVADQPRERREFDQREIELVEGVAAVLGAALETANLLESEAKAREAATVHARRMTVLKTIGDVASSTLDVRALAQRVADVTPGLLGTSLVTIMVRDSDGDGLVPVAASGVSPESLKRFTPAPADTLAAEAFHTAKSIWIEDWELDDAAHSRSDQPGTASFAVLPLASAGNTLGTLSLAWSSPRSFDDSEVSFLESYASDLAVGLERAQLFRELRQSEVRFRSLFESMTEGFALCEIVFGPEIDGFDLRVLQVNPAFKKQSGLEPEDVVGRSVLELFPDILSTGFGAIAEVISTGQPVHFQYFFPSLGMWFEISAYMTEQQRLAIVFSDVTERKTAEDAVAIIAARLDAHINNSPIAVVEFDSDLRITRWSEGAERMFGWCQAEMLGKALPDLKWVYDEDQGLVDVEFARLFGKQTSRSVNVNRNYRKDGSVIWCEWYNSAAYDPDGKLVSLLSQVLDTTERTMAEEALRESEQRLARSQEMAHLGSWELDLVADVLTWTDEVYRIFGLEPQEFEATYEAFLEAVHPDDRSAVDEAYSGSVREGRDSYEIEHRVVRKHTGEVRYVHEKARHMRDHTGSVVGSEGMVHDITQRKLAEQRVLEAQRETDAERSRLRQIIDELPIGVTLLDAEGAILEVNEATERVWAGTLPRASGKAGYGVYKARDHVSGKRFEQDDWPAVHTLETGQQASRIADIERYDGTVGTVRFTTVPLRNEEGALKGVIGLTVDISHEIEEQRFVEALNGINREINATLDAEEILHTLLDSCGHVLHTKSCALVAKERNRWVVREPARRRRTKAATQLADFRLGIALRAIDARQPVVINDESDPLADVALMGSLDIHTMLAIPIIVQDEAFGVLLFENRTKDGPFSAEEIGFAHRLMDIATLALQNARLYERERAIAETLQNAILIEPEKISGIDVAYLYQPAATTANVGGDFYDIFELPDGRITIVVGDVSGKGIEAARLTSLLRDGIRAYSFESGDPAGVLERVNNLVHRSAQTGEFATVFLGVLDTSAGTLTYSSGGHPPAGLFGSDDVTFLEDVHSPIVGGFENVRFSSATRDFCPGDSLVLYTDALIEARRDGEQFGEWRLLEVMRTMRKRKKTAELPEALLAEVRQFTGGALQDDIVIMALRRT